MSVNTEIRFGEVMADPGLLLPPVSDVVAQLAVRDHRIYHVIGMVAEAAAQSFPQAQPTRNTRHGERTFIAICLLVFKMDEETAANYLFTWRDAAYDLSPPERGTRPRIEQARSTIHRYMEQPDQLPHIWLTPQGAP